MTILLRNNIGSALQLADQLNGRVILKKFT